MRARVHLVLTTVLSAARSVAGESLLGIDDRYVTPSLPASSSGGTPSQCGGASGGLLVSEGGSIAPPAGSMQRSWQAS